MERYRRKINRKDTGYAIKELLRDEVLDPSQSFLTVAALGMLGLASETFLPGTGKDLFGSAAQTAFTRKFGKHSTTWGRYPRAYPVTLQLATNFLWEIGQKFGINPGTYDIKDFFAYIGGSLIWLGIYQASNKFRRRGLQRPR